MQPGSISGTLACTGSATSFSTPIVLGASSYTWTLPAGWSGSGNANNIFATPGSSGVFTLVAGNNCGVSPQQTLSVTVYSSPTISVNSGTICYGQSFTIVASGAANYTYSGGQVVSPPVSSSYSITGVDAAGCKSSVISTVTVNQLPGINVSTNVALLCIGESATLTAIGTSLTYSFNPGGAGALSIISPTVTSTYTVTGTAANGCNNTAIVTQNVDACTGVKENMFDRVSNEIYPNPTKGIINVQMLVDGEIIILNALGQVVFSFALQSGNHQINIESLPKGVYIVNINNATRSKKLKVVKE